MTEDDILVAKRSVTWMPKWSLNKQHSTSALTWSGQANEEAQLNQLVGHIKFLQVCD